MEAFTRITIGIITILFTVELVFTMDITGTLLIIPTILTPLIIATTILIVTEGTSYTDTIIIPLIIIVIRQLDTEVHYPHIQIAEG